MGSNSNCWWGYVIDVDSHNLLDSIITHFYIPGALLAGNIMNGERKNCDFKFVNIWRVYRVVCRVIITYAICYALPIGIQDRTPLIADYEIIAAIKIGNIYMHYEEIQPIQSHRFVTAKRKRSSTTCHFFALCSAEIPLHCTT